MRALLWVSCSPLSETHVHRCRFPLPNAAGFGLRHRLWLKPYCPAEVGSIRRSLHRADHCGVCVLQRAAIRRSCSLRYRELSTPLTGLVSRPPDKGFLAVVAATIAAFVAFARDARVGRTLLVALVIVLVIVDLRAFVRFYRTADERAAVPNYHRVSTWISQAECFKKTGVLFAICGPSGVLKPVEDATIADDRGHGLLLSVLHRWFDVPATKLSLVVINAAFTVIAFLLLAWQFVRLHRAVAAIVFLGLTLRLVCSSDVDVFSTYFGLLARCVDADVYSTYFGLFALSFLLPLQLLRMLAQQRSRPSEWAWLVVAGLALICAMLFREPIGLIGCVMTLLALALGLWRRMRAVRAVDFAVIGSTVAVILLAMNTLGYLPLTAYIIRACRPARASFRMGSPTTCTLASALSRTRLAFNGRIKLVTIPFMDRSDDRFRIG